MHIPYTQIFSHIRLSLQIPEDPKIFHWPAYFYAAYLFPVMLYVCYKHLASWKNDLLCTMGKYSLRDILAVDVCIHILAVCTVFGYNRQYLSDYNAEDGAGYCSEYYSSYVVQAV